MSRNLLHKSKLEELKSWLDLKGIPHRAGRGDWQLLQVLQPGKSSWDVIYERLNMKEHVTVTRPLEGLIHQFIQESKQDGIQSRNPIQQAVPEAAAPRAPDSGGEPSPPWDA